MAKGRVAHSATDQSYMSVLDFRRNRSGLRLLSEYLPNRRVQAVRGPASEPGKALRSVAIGGAQGHHVR
jgi:hypothetical protein